MSGSIASPHGTETRSASIPHDRQIACQRSEKAPQVRFSTLFWTVETTALSITSVALPVAVSTSPPVRTTCCRRGPSEA